MTVDMELNQYLAKHIMESWSLEVIIANNGRIATNLLPDADYDLILMNIQMPEMDGIQAISSIGKMKDQRKARIPIIGLTANALKGDSEKYLKAGMNNYLSKPFK
jgi:CheY-like chemotaxis protein